MLALTLDTLDGLSENLKGAYVAKGDKFVLDVELPDVAGKDAELTDWKKKHTAAEKLAKTAADTAADLQRKLDAKEAAHGQTDQKITDLLAKWELDAKAREEAREKAVREELRPAVEKVTKYELDNALEEAFVKNGGRVVKKGSMLKIAKGDWTLENGKPVIKDRDGNVTTKSLDEYFSKDYKTAEPEHYEGSKGSGGGAPGNTSTSIPSAPAFDLNNLTQSLRTARANGQTE